MFGRSIFLFYGIVFHHRATGILLLMFAIVRSLDRLNAMRVLKICISLEANEKEIYLICLAAMKPKEFDSSVMITMT